jgi:hypothetical protein
MTGSWTMDQFIIGSVILILVPASLWVYREIINKKRGDKE